MLVLAIARCFHPGNALPIFFRTPAELAWVIRVFLSTAMLEVEHREDKPHSVEVAGPSNPRSLVFPLALVHAEYEIVHVTKSRN